MVEINWWNLIKQIGVFHTTFATLVVVLMLLSYVAGQEIRLTPVLSHNRNCYIYVLNGITYVSLARPYRFDPGWRMDTQTKSLGYGTEDFETPVEQALYRYFSIGIYRGPMYAVISFPSVLLLIPFIWRCIKLKKKNPFACPHCGYDLRASTDRCPECGTAIKSPLSK